MNGAREFDLLRGQIAVWIVAKLLSQHQDAVQWRAQFVRHVGEELRFVLRSESKFFGLLLQSAPRLLNFFVLAFDFAVLCGELLRFLRQLLVRLLKFALLSLQLGRQLL